VGGERLREAGAEVVFPSEAIAAMGLVEAVGRLPALVRARRVVLDRFGSHRPDLFVPVDFGGLNLRLARAARGLGIPVVYYIPPKVWAWGAKRVERLRAAVDEALVILPFEEEYLRERSVPAVYVGSPVLDHLAPRAFEPEHGTVGLLPGSRAGEVSRILPVLAEAARLLSGRRPGLRFLVPRASGLALELVEGPLRGRDLAVEVLDGRAQEVMERSRLCLVASGTATLECAAVGTPMVVVYRANPLTYALARRLVRVPLIALPNLIAGRAVVPEFVQTGPEPVAEAAFALLDDGPARAEALAGLADVRTRLGGPGASARAAQRIAARLPKPR
jgi:lipid-A-disaccharide synthase